MITELCPVMQHNMSPPGTNTTLTLSCERELTVGFHPHCGVFGVWEGWVLDHTGHAVLVLEVGGEAEVAAQGGGAVRVSGFSHVHSKRGIWGRKVVDQPADLWRRPAADSGARHRLVVRAVYDLWMNR